MDIFNQKKYGVEPEHFKAIYDKYKTWSFSEDLSFDQFFKIYQMAFFEDIGEIIKNTNNILLQLSEEVESLRKNN